ncbi:MAG: hypothetical protein KAR12_16300 [Methylococcales bacterium]|nr:hypothetical protein [Methylococcales bacterium]
MATSDNQTKTFWLEHIEHWQTTELSQAAYCQQHELVAHQFSYWKRKLVAVANASPASKSSLPGFAHVQIESARSQASGLSLHFVDGTRLEGIGHNNMMLVYPLIEKLR